MNAVAEILGELSRRGATVRAEGGTLWVKPRRVLDDNLLARIREYKPEILKLVSNGIAPCGSPHCAGCYDIGDGLKIHPPKCSPEWLEWLKRWEPQTGRPQ